MENIEKYILGASVKRQGKWDRLKAWPRTIEQVDQTTYAAIQKVVRQFIVDEHSGAITPVQFDDIYWRILNK